MSAENPVVFALTGFRNETETELQPKELQLAYTILEVLVAVVAVIGNALVILVFRKERRLRRRTNYYIVSLAVADLLVGLLGIPFAVMASIGLPTNLHACLFTLSILVVLCTISIFCLVAVSVDRYWAILHPMGYSRNVRTKTAIVIISMCWLAGSAVGFLPLFGWHSGTSVPFRCYFVEVMNYHFLVFLYFATIITPSLVLAAFYAHIYRVVVKQLRQIVTMNPEGRRSGNGDRNKSRGGDKSGGGGGTMLRVLGAAQKREVKATQNLAIIVLFFMICWIPLYTINCIMAFCPQCDIPLFLTDFCIILSHLNSAVNPILYAYHLRDFRAAMKSLIYSILKIKETNPPNNDYYKPSIISHNQRQQSIAEKRTSVIHNNQPKIYVDSPVWLRQKAAEVSNSSLVTSPATTILPTGEDSPCSISPSAQPCVQHQPSSREMWMISEVPSVSDERDSSHNGLAVISRNEERNMSPRLSDDYDDDDEVFLPRPVELLSVTQYDFEESDTFVTELPFRENKELQCIDEESEYIHGSLNLQSKNSYSLHHCDSYDITCKLPKRSSAPTSDSVYFVGGNGNIPVTPENESLQTISRDSCTSIHSECGEYLQTKNFNLSPLKIVGDFLMSKKSGKVVKKSGNGEVSKSKSDSTSKKSSADVIQYLDLHRNCDKMLDISRSNLKDEGLKSS